MGGYVLEFAHFLLASFKGLCLTIYPVLANGCATLVAQQNDMETIPLISKHTCHTYIVSKATAQLTKSGC